MLNAIHASGYPLEIAMALTADEVGYEVMPGWTWWDERASKPRELDIVASRRFCTDEGTNTVVIHALAECKACRPGMVIFESTLDQHNETHSGNLYMAHSWGQPSALKRRAEDGHGASFAHRFGWATRAWRPTETVGTQFGVLRPRKANKSNGTLQGWEIAQEDAYEYVDGLMHGLLAFKREEGHVLNVSSLPPSAHMNLAALALVIDGPLYSYRSNPPPRRLRRIKSGTIYRSGRLRDRRYAFRIDVMGRRQFAPFLSGLQEDGEAVRQELSSVGQDVIVASIKSFGNSQDE